MYEINYTNGQASEDFPSLDACIDRLTEQYPDLEYGHDGDLSNGGDRTLVWANYSDSLNDDGANAVASIRFAE
jgi:hypothetical protein